MKGFGVIREKEENVDFDKIRCKDCKYYCKVYIHPWSKGVDDNLKRTYKAFICTLSFDDIVDEAFPSVMVGKTDSVGCECFTRRGKIIKENGEKFYVRYDGDNKPGLKINLTKAFGKGKEPKTEKEFDRMFPSYRVYGK